MNDDFNPFAINSYFGNEYFCDRKSEIQTLLLNIKNRNSTTLISQRRMGKTSLIQHLFNNLPPKHISISLDIFSTNSRADLLNNLTTAIATTVPEESNIGKKIWKFIKSLQPNIGFDPLTGAPSVSFKLSPQENDTYIESVFNFLEAQPQKVVIAIDEFQQILQYPEANTDVWLRTFIQKLNNVVFIFSGSQTHLMADLFTNPQRAFYRSTQFINLNKIDSEIYSTFIKRLFKKEERNISQGIINQIIDWTHGHTYYVQAVCAKLFDTGIKEISTEELRIAKLSILSAEQSFFMKYRNLLSNKQWKLLNAIAIESRLLKPTSAAFISEYKLGSSAVVLRALDALIKKDMVYYDYNDDGTKFHAVIDVFFERWAQWKNI